MQNLTGAASAPAIETVATAGRRLFQAGSGSGVQVQVNVQAAANIQAAVQAALEQAVSTGAFQASLSDAGESMLCTTSAGT